MAGHRTETRRSQNEFRSMAPQRFYSLDLMLKSKLQIKDKQWGCRSPGGWETVFSSLFLGKARASSLPRALSSRCQISVYPCEAKKHLRWCFFSQDGCRWTWRGTRGSKSKSKMESDFRSYISTGSYTSITSKEAMKSKCSPCRARNLVPSDTEAFLLPCCGVYTATSRSWRQGEGRLLGHPKSN